MKRRSQVRIHDEPKKLIKLSQNSAKNGEKSAVKDEPLNLTDLDDYCLEVIFKYLPLVDLLNIAQSNERFVAEARLSARRLFREKTVKINTSSIEIVEQLHEWNCVENVYDKICFKENPMQTISMFFKNFGNAITDLKVVNKFQIDDDTTLGQFIDTYLKQLEHFKLQCHLDQMQSKLESEMVDSEIIQNIKKLMTYSVPRIQFTSLLQLELIQVVNTVDLNEIVDFICQNPGLVQLTMKYADWSRYQFSDEHISKIIDSLPNLSELSLEHDTMSARGVEYILTNSKSLKKLRLFVYCKVIGYDYYDDYLFANIGTDWKVTLELFDEFIYRLEFNRTD
ncbi:uncharacterized protein LOC116349531 [Contarinia nasturtii]|uniref:uncharacterized protein LOC116349531 n=1 Tax=Contarinia nasturtii TaxID=265458 RepID=UPI0012D44689|nr:uncharacterized protein LOC116349531 [Contarinia nasturtii]